MKKKAFVEINSKNIKNVCSMLRYNIYIVS